MTRLLVALLFLLAWALPSSAQHFIQGTAHITTQTTTTVQLNPQPLAGSVPRALTIMAGSICVDAGGATTAVTIQDSLGLNLFGPGIVWPLQAASCLNFPFRGFAYGLPTGVGRNVQVVTGTGNGPVEVYLELVNQ